LAHHQFAVANSAVTLINNTWRNSRAEISASEMQIATTAKTGSINPSGVIAGIDVDFSGFHGFLRAADGTITTFDVPGLAGISSINPSGAVTGYRGDPIGFHGFVRAADGTITSFDVPGIQSDPRTSSINPSGAITGYNYIFNGEHAVGFVRAPDGAITTFEAPDAFDTFANSINPSGTIAGYYEDLNGFHGFVRNKPHK
jgi:hypothetical protein